ncbi:MAG: Mut7-C RNAse domain-containing protein, partial [Desulfovibrionaceae bacterium]
DYPVTRRASLKDAVESLGPPHTEVHGLACDKKPASFGDLLEPGSCIDVYPAAPPVDVTRPQPLRPAFDRVAFLVDQNVAKLAGLLRLLGLDAVHDPGFSDQDLARLALEDKRILLSRDTALLKRSSVVHGRLIRAADPWDQLREVLDFYAVGPLAPLSRCPCCNQKLQPVAKKDIVHRLLPKTRTYYHAFHICPACERIYWPGSHVDRLIQRLHSLCGTVELEKSGRRL